MAERAVLAALGLAVALQAGCASPAARLDRRARDAGFELLVLAGDSFHLRAYAGSGPGSRLHVYLEGDGRPFTAATQIAADPHPRRTLAFELMALDPAPRLLLGRPCYHRALEDRDPCSPALWTDRRYGPEVVSSLEQALRAYLEDTGNRGGQGYEELVLVGYSGGGVLAMLLAERFSNTRALVTVAANLDLAAWVAHHRYTPLLGSLDPARRSPLPAAIVQLHLVGDADAVVPAETTLRVTGRQPNARVLRYPDFDHTCCWTRVWPEVLRELEAELERAPRPP